jgi:hypothetical protein
VSRRKATEGLDFEALRVAIERCDLDVMLGFYAEDAQLSIINVGAVHAPPFELRGKAEIARHLRASFGPGTSHRVERVAAVGVDRVTFREACDYPDGARVVVETTLELSDGNIVRQTDLVAVDARGQIRLDPTVF